METIIFVSCIYIYSHVFLSLFLSALYIQKARLARIRIAKASSGAAFVSKKKAVEARLAAQESGLEIEDGKDEDIFELQHHHLLRCLEKTTVSFISFSFLQLLSLSVFPICRIYVKHIYSIYWHIFVTVRMYFWVCMYTTHFVYLSACFSL